VQPLGRQYNPDAAFRDLTRPAVLKNTGAIIAPIKYTKPLAKQAAEITGNAHKPKVLTVSGGVMKLPKKATKH
jgi:U3 small nucleolar RNA-associated protein 14